MKLKLQSLVIILIFLIPCQIFAAVDQTYVERILKENREFIEFINIGISNFSKEKREDLKGVYQKHFTAEVAFLQGEYQRAFDNIYDSQKDMVVLCEYLLKNHYLEDSKKILDDLAPRIIRSDNSQARKYLTLGYRDRTVARTFVQIGEASHPRLYSYKIFKYVEAIKMSRRAKRYGFLALYTSQTVASKRKIFNEMLKNENKKGSIFFKRFIDKDEKEYIAEMNKDFSVFEKEYYDSLKKDTDSKNNGKDLDEKTETFEKRVERRVRYRKENRLALYLLNGEFEKGEPLIRFYVDDYIYKLVYAGLNIIENSNDHKEAGQSGGEYKKYILHHKDNYGYLADGSLLDELQTEVKVLDNIKKKKQNETSGNKSEVKNETDKEVKNSAGQKETKVK